MRARKNETAGRILAFIAGKRGARVREIAAKLKLGEQNVGATLKRLLEQDCVERERVQDGRVVIDEDENVSRANYCFVYSITEKGQERLQRIAGGQE